MDKNMKKRLICFPLILLLITTFVRAEQVLVNEDVLAQKFLQDSPSLLEIETAIEQARYNLQKQTESFQFESQNSAYYEATSEPAYATFIPVTSPIKSFESKFVRPTKYGLQVGVGAAIEESSSSLVHRGTTSSIGVELEMDLYRDLFGRTTQATIEELSHKKRISELEGKIQKQIAFNQIRTIYWNLVATEESLKISETLLSISIKQVREAKKRLQSRIADRGEVAKYQSQVAARRANLNFFRYQKSEQLQALGEVIPALAGKDIKLSSYNIDRTVAEVLSCTAKISSINEPPMEYTYYDEVIAEIAKMQSSQKRVRQYYDGVDVSLSTELRRLGKAEGFGNSTDHFKDESTHAYNIALAVNIPLGSRKKTTKEALRELQEKANQAKTQANLARVKAYHYEISKQVGMLQEVVASQRENSSQLEISLKETNKKYKQARVSVQELTQEQDQLFQSSLNEIQTKLNVVLTLINYFSVYTDTPCDINKRID